MNYIIHATQRENGPFLEFNY